MNHSNVIKNVLFLNIFEGVEFELTDNLKEKLNENNINHNDLHELVNSFGNFKRAKGDFSRQGILRRKIYQLGRKLQIDESILNEIFTHLRRDTKPLINSKSDKYNSLILNKNSDGVDVSSSKKINKQKGEKGKDKIANKKELEERQKEKKLLLQLEKLNEEKAESEKEQKFIQENKIEEERKKREEKEGLGQNRFLEEQEHRKRLTESGKEKELKKQKLEEKNSKLLNKQKLEKDNINKSKGKKIKIKFLFLGLIPFIIVLGYYLLNVKTLEPTNDTPQQTTKEQKNVEGDINLHSKNKPLPGTGFVSCVVEFFPQKIAYYIIQRDDKNNWYILKKEEDFKRENNQIDASKNMSEKELKKAMVSQIFQEAQSNYSIKNTYCITDLRYKNDRNVNEFSEILDEKGYESIKLRFIDSSLKKKLPFSVHFLLSRPYHDN